MKNSYIYNGIDFTGFRNGKLTVIKKAEYGRSQWLCRCDCGNEKILPVFRIKEYKSCGCLEKENKKTLGAHNITHGKTKTRLYAKYCKMKERCFNPNYKYYHRYGGRGIKICEEWLNKDGFKKFAEWSYKNGYDDTIKGYAQSIDRIDVDGDYEPSNCKWSNQKEQCRNRGNTLYIDFEGKRISCAEFCEITKIKYDWARRKIKNGFSSSEIINCWKARNHEL